MPVRQILKMGDARLLRIVEERLGHGLLARAEAAKIAVAEGRVTLNGATVTSPALNVGAHPHISLLLSLNL